MAGSPGPPQRIPVVAGHLATPHSILQQQLNQYLDRMHETSPEVLRERPEAYLTQWSTGDSRWLSRFHDAQHAESVYHEAMGAIAA